MTTATATVSLSETAAAFVAAVNSPGAFTAVLWTSDVKPAAAHKGVRLHKVTRATVRTGVDYANLAVNADREVGSLPWGQWAVFPYIVTHKGQDYARLYVVDDSVRTTYFVDGHEVSRETFGEYLTPAARKARRPNGGTITVKCENLRILR